MAKLKSLLTDIVAINDGMWVTVNPALYDDLQIKTRGFTDQFVDAQQARFLKAKTDLNLREVDPLPNAVGRKINARLAQDFLVLDVRGLEDEDGQTVGVEPFKKMLENENASRLVRAVFEAAGRVSSKTMESQVIEVGNSPEP